MIRSDLSIAAQKANYPATIVVANNQRVIYQRLVESPNHMIAEFSNVYFERKNAYEIRMFSIESRTGEVVYNLKS